MNSDFIQAWRAWIRCDAPIANSRRGRGNAPSYAIELELDHLLSYVYSLGESAISGKQLRYRHLARPELGRLATLEVQLADCQLSQPERDRFEACFRLTRSVLEALCDVSDHPVAGTTGRS